MVKILLLKFYLKIIKIIYSIDKFFYKNFIKGLKKEKSNCNNTNLNYYHVKSLKDYRKYKNKFNVDKIVRRKV